MKAISLLLLVLAVLLGGCARSTPPLPTATNVDLRRYSGRWYEIARLPNFFQRDGALATAEYTLQPDGRVRVRNTEIRADGQRKAVEGTAAAVPASENARLRVKFGGLAALAPVASAGNYWIIALEPDYSVALVGTPNRKFLWLLARKPTVPAATRDRMIQRAKALGFPVEKLLIADWSASRE